MERIDKRAPMASAPMQYLADGSVNWGNMWDSFCILAQEGGPPHRGIMLMPQAAPDVASESYLFARNEIIRGVKDVSGLTAVPAEPGWLSIQCPSASMARWLSEAIVEENVTARYDGQRVFVPVGDNYTLKGEIKNVITAVAKTTHYWQEHLAAEVKQTLAIQSLFDQMVEWVKMRFK